MPVFCQRGFACGETARPVIGPAFWVCRAKSGAAFRCAKPPCAVVRFAAMTSSPRTDVLACPAFALLSHSPTALLNIPALVAIRLHFAARNRAGRSLPPPGATCSLPHFRFAQMWPRIFPRGLPGYVPLFHGWPRARTPALVGLRLRFACGETARPVVAPAGGNVLATPFSLRSNVAPRSHPGPCSRSVAFRLRRNRAGRSSAPPFGFAAQNQARHFTPRNRAAGYRPHLLGLPRKIGRGISLRETTLGGRPLRGHGFAAPHRPFPLPAAAAPTTA